MRIHISTAAILLALVTIAASTPTAAPAQSLSDAATTGLTTVQWSRASNTYTWTLTNNSGSAADSTTGYDVLVSSLQPFGVPAPVSWTAPAGWEWRANGGYQAFEISQPSRKYYSGPAIGPGQSAAFTYTFEPGTPLINGGGSNPGGPAFLTHVAAVKTTPTVKGDALSWTPTSVSGLGASWHDASTTSPAPTPGVSEMPGALALVIGALWLVTCALRARRRASGVGARFVTDTKF